MEKRYNRDFSRVFTTVMVAVLTVLLIAAGFSADVEKAFAASAKVSLSGGGTVEKGDSLTITLKYSGATFGSATARVTYDSSILEYSSCSGAEANGGGGTVILTMANGSGVESLSCKLKFKAKKAGSTSVSVSTTDVYNIDLEELSASSASTTVTVKSTADKASTNADLSAMRVSSGTLSPSFSPSVTSYKVKVHNSVTTCTISADKADSKSSVSVTGSPDLKVGENVRKVTVTAESGKTKTYTITITREAAEGSSSGGGQSGETGQNSGSSDAQPSENQPIETEIGGTAYIVCEDFEKVEIPETFHEDAAAYNDKQIPVIRSAEGNMVLALLKPAEASGEEAGQETAKEAAWYFYSEKNNKFTAKHSMTVDEIFAYGKSMSDNAASMAGGTDLSEGGEKQNSAGLDADKMMYLIFGGTLALLLIAVIVLQIGIMKGRKR
ncbi:MAG: cadherin-like beta sandwich domain-containing protein [Anaerovoracaceae bacterium]